MVDAVPCMQDGHWSDVSGDTFLRTLLSMPVEAAKYDLVSTWAMHAPNQPAL